MNAKTRSMLWLGIAAVAVIATTVLRPARAETPGEIPQAWTYEGSMKPQQPAPTPAPNIGDGAMVAPRPALQRRQAPASRQNAGSLSATAATASAKWAKLGSLPFGGGLDIYSDPVTMRRSGKLAQMGGMWDFKTAQVNDGKRFLSVKSQYEYDCDRPQRRMLATTGYAGHLDTASVVGSGDTPQPWEPAPPTNYAGELWRIACGKK